MYDLNDAEEQRADGVIPDGTFVKLQGMIRPGGAHGENPRDVGLLKASTKSDALMLDWEYTVLHGPYARRKIWEYMTVAGGTRDANGASKAWNVAKPKVRAMLDSSRKLNPKDISEATKLLRRFDAWTDLSGIIFAAKIGIELGAPNPNGGFYRDKNTVAYIVVPGDPEYDAIMAGVDVPPKPSGSRTPRAAAPAASPGGGWSVAAAPAQTAAGSWGSTTAANAGAGTAPAYVAPVQAPAAAGVSPSAAGAGPEWLRQ